MIQVTVWLCVPLASVEQHLCPGCFWTSPGGSVPQSRRSSPQHQLADAQTSWDQPSRRKRLPGKQKERKVGWKQGGREEKREEKTMCKASVHCQLITLICLPSQKRLRIRAILWNSGYHGNSPEGHLFQQVSIHLVCCETLCLVLLLYRGWEEGRGAGRREEVGSILRLWGSQV